MYEEYEIKGHDLVTTGHRKMMDFQNEVVIPKMRELEELLESLKELKPV